MRVYLPAEEQDAPVVICSELPTNEGTSITHAAERLAAEVIRYHRLATPIAWIEHHPPITTDGDAETFDLALPSPATRSRRGDRAWGRGASR